MLKSSLIKHIAAKQVQVFYLRRIV